MSLLSLSSEQLNGIGALVGALIVILVAAWRRFKADSSPKTESGDRMIPGITIADMNPIRELAGEQKGTRLAMERLAVSLESILKILMEQAKEEAIEAEVDRRFHERRREEDDERERARVARTRRVRN